MKISHLAIAFVLAMSAQALAKQSSIDTPPPSPQLAIGAVAPDFTAIAADGHIVKLSDFRGQFVLLEFWSTNCGCCTLTMPILEKVHRQFEDHGLVVLGVCVWDDETKFQAWMANPRVRTSYLKVHDPAGRNIGESIARRLYQVPVLPTQFLIDRRGVLRFADLGAGPGPEKRLMEALAQAGFVE